MIKKLSVKKRGQVNTIAPAILLLVFASVVLVFGLIILQEIRDTPVINAVQTNNSNSAWGAANETLVAMGSFADFWEIIVLAIVISVVIGLLLVVFGGRGRR